MPYIPNELISKIATMYMEINAKEGDSPKTLYDLYAHAEIELGKINKESQDEHMKNFSL